MTTIRGNRYLRAIFAFSKWTGLQIQEKQDDGSFSKNIKFWEVAVHVTISCAFVATMSVLINTIPSFKITYIGTPLVVFLLYSVTLCNSINLIKNKKKFSLLLKKFDEMARFPSFKKLHENLADKICRRVMIFTFGSLVLSIICLLCGLVSFSILTTNSDQYQQTPLPKNLTEDEIMMMQMTGKHVITYSVLESVILVIHGCVIFALLIKMYVMNSLMFLSHEFLIEELHILVRYVKLLRYDKLCRAIAFQNNTTLDNWLHFFKKINQYV